MELSPDGMKRLFTDEAFAIAWLEKVRWDGKPSCPSCGSHSAWTAKSKHLKVGTRGCKDCGRIYNVTTDTPLVRTMLPINKWLHALYLMERKPSMKASELAHATDIGMTSAYRLHELILEILQKENDHD